jgi:hypothetical protein
MALAPVVRANGVRPMPVGPVRAVGPSPMGPDVAVAARDPMVTAVVTRVVGRLRGRGHPYDQQEQQRPLHNFHYSLILCTPLS